MFPTESPTPPRSVREIADEMLQHLLRLSAWGLHDSRMDELRALADGYRAELERSDLPEGQQPVVDPRSEAARRESAIRTIINDRNRAIDELDTMREVAQGNKRHVKYLTEENEALRAEAARVRTQVAEDLRPLLADLVDPDACWFDHHGHCQAHGWFVSEQRCPHARAKAWLAEGPGKGFPSARAALPDVVGTRVLDGACHSVWLHGKWRWLTQQMTTPEKEAFADAVDRAGDALADGEPRLPVDRWWREPADVVGTQQPDCPNCRRYGAPARVEHCGPGCHEAHTYTPPCELARHTADESGTPDLKEG